MTVTAWVIAFVLSSYTLYSNSPAIFITSYALQIGAFILGLSCFFRWLQLVMGSTRFRDFPKKISELSMPEFSSLVYITATILYFVAIQVWNTCQQDIRWQTLMESTLGYYAVAALFFNFALLGAHTKPYFMSLLSVKLRFFSGSWSDHPHVGRNKYEAAELEANFRPPCVA